MNAAAVVPKDRPVVTFHAWPGNLPFPSRSLTIWIPDHLTMERLGEGEPTPGTDNPAALLAWIALEVERSGVTVLGLGGAE